MAGAGFGGVNAALQLAKRGYEVKLLDKNSHHTFVPGLIDLLRGRKSEKKLKLDLENFFGSTSVEFSQETVLGIDPENDKVETTKDSHSYDHLVMALGGEAATYGLDVSDAETCYNLEQAKSLTEKVEDAEEVIIAGCGYVGVEIAGELVENDIDVTVMDMSTRPAANSNMETSQNVVDYFNRKDVKFRGGTEIEEVNEDSVVLGNGEEVETDVVIWSGGVQASSLVQESFDVGPKGIPVNSGLSSKQHENVFAIGDNADGDFLKIAQNAEKQGKLVAENIDRNGALKSFESSKVPLAISMGNTGVIEYGNITFENRLVRPLKDLVRVHYFMKLRGSKWRAKLGL